MDHENDYMFQAMESEVKAFGEKFVKYAMNRTLDAIKRDIDGSCTAPDSIELRKELETFSQEQINTLTKCVNSAVTSCMFNMMVMVNENDDIHLSVDSGDGDKEIKDLSDGLEGDLWSWIDWWGMDQN